MPAARTPKPIVYTNAVRALHCCANPQRARVYRSYFKDPGQDVFLGVSTREMRQVARQFQALPMTDVRRLMRSRVHEERSLAHAILRWKFEKGSEAERGRIFRFYLRHRRFIHSWDGVDDSAPYLVGPYLLDRDKTLLYELARSPRLWDRRIAMVATLSFIRSGQLNHTLKLADVLMHDEEDLIHKACGWMLREVGKRNLDALQRFLSKRYKKMPRTMLRYAIERFPERDRQRYLKGKI